jgi:lysophospholipase L1-like esterase
MKPSDLVTVVFMGDSITEGQYVAPPDRWVDIVSNNLQLKYKDDPLTLILLVKGISGETTRQGLERFPRDVQAHAPEVMTLQFGLNDANCWASDYGLPRVSEDAYRANLIEMIERAKRFGTGEIILSNNHTTLRHKPLLNGKTLEEQRKRYNEILYEVAKATQVTFCDIDEEFNRLDDLALEQHLLPYPDLLHLSKLGHKKYAGIIESYVRRAIERVAIGKGALKR